MKHGKGIINLSAGTYYYENGDECYGDWRYNAKHGKGKFK
jgi:hypothetical protein